MKGFVEDCLQRLVATNYLETRAIEVIVEPVDIVDYSQAFAFYVAVVCLCFCQCFASKGNSAAICIRAAPRPFIDPSTSNVASSTALPYISSNALDISCFRYCLSQINSESCFSKLRSVVVFSENFVFSAKECDFCF